MAGRTFRAPAILKAKKEIILFQIKTWQGLRCAS
jgi:hypothetical protein